MREKIIGPIIGYKAFNKDFTNRYGMKFEVGKTYNIDGEIKFGVKGNGFHLCSSFEDTFRYFDTEEGFILTEVEANGKIVSYDDEYNGYYDMYAASEIKIIRIIERTEIIEMIKNITYADYRIKKVIDTLYLTDEEINELLPYFEKFLTYNKSYQKILVKH